jgi:hypothetical protein
MLKYVLRNTSGSLQQLPNGITVKPLDLVTVPETMLAEPSLKIALARGTFNVVKQVEVEPPAVVAEESEAADVPESAKDAVVLSLDEDKKPKRRGRPRKQAFE